ncbi:hypothetical protein C6H88_01655 [Chlamydia muridarum str. Nigg]|nr:hypothetical protein C6H96_01655 [Chlamydia muridarum str. Nigg]UFW32864.1 hypothetical protein FTM91_01740 [Chlamydia trachomatis]UFX96603.1 hypothetical protein FTM74_01735 [Chlamydia muridarum]AVM88979.1 hypothetical protein C6H95_01655 [Chlamydia muridarum str. Nigg]AVM89879.1 hypothetical protein C6H94_01655 [Chlamydia muridarum str. Nigg]
MFFVTFPCVSVKDQSKDSNVIPVGSAVPPVLLFGLLYFSFNVDPTACTGICITQDCPEESVSCLVIGGIVVVVVGAVTVSSKVIGSVDGVVALAGCVQVPCIKKVRIPVF